MTNLPLTIPAKDQSNQDGFAKSGGVSMSTASGQSVRSTSPVANTARLRRRPGRALMFLMILLSMIIGLVVVVLFCYTSGEEFNPSNFQTRSFLVYRIPGTNLQFLPTFRQSTGSTVPSEVLRNLNASAPASGWHIAKSDSYGGEFFPAGLLLKALGRTDTDWNLYWDGWSKSHAKLAAVLWPTIQSMAMGQLYNEIPETLRFAEGYQGSPEAFAKELHMEIHRLVERRKEIYETAKERPSGSAALDQCIPEWRDVQKWLDAHPIP
jgi:hypothetical protein